VAGIKELELLSASLARHVATAYGWSELAWPVSFPQSTWSHLEEFVVTESRRMFEGVVDIRDLLPPNSWAKQAEKLVIRAWKKSGYKFERPGRGICYSWPRESRPGFLHWLTSRNGELQFRSTLHLGDERAPSICESLSSCLGVGGGFAQIRVGSATEVDEAVDRTIWWCSRFESVVDNWSARIGVA
jgi:hypothetical protein